VFSSAVAEPTLAALFAGVTMTFVWAALLIVLRTSISHLTTRYPLLGRYKRFLAWGAGLLCFATLGFAVIDLSSDKRVPFAPKPEISAVVAGNTALALDLYREVKGARGNIFFSPYSISTCLALVYAGARGSTETEFAQAAHFSLKQAELHPAYGELVARMKRLQHGSRLSLITANALWYQQGDPFSTAFLSVAQTDYHADLQGVDFRDAPKIAASEINKWLESRTRGRIKGTLPPDSLGGFTKMVLCSAIHFKANWRSQFKVENTREGQFYISPDQTVPVPMMWQSADFKLARIESPGVALLELPYFGGDLAMIIILPEEVVGPSELENSLTPENLDSWLAQVDAANPHKVNVRLPRFTAQQRLDLEPVLRSLGAPSAFDYTADFRGIDGMTNLFISQALHHALVEVNEQGTEAAAVTLFEAKSKSMNDRFNADHPFIYLIRDRGSGTILFLGRFAEPADTENSRITEHKTETL
jgi:serpin B